MKIKIINAQKETMESISNRLEDIVENTVARLEKEQGVEIEDVVIEDVEYMLGLKVKGMEEVQFLSVEHHEGVPEVFMWVVDAEEGTAESNNEASFYDSWSVAKMQGLEQEFKTINSIFTDHDLGHLNTETFGNMEKHTFEHVGGYNVVRVYQDGRLVQEFKVLPKEETAE